MLDLVKKIEQNIKEHNLIAQEDGVVIGVSGGPDSMLLLYVLNELKTKLNFKIYVAHINHGIREEAGYDESLVKNFCEKNNIQFFPLHADVLSEAKKHKLSTEECGRCVRYEFFNKVLEETRSKKIAVAHNLGDNAETILLNLIRGAGLNGISGMKYMTGNIIRPMLDISKEDILEFLKEKNLEYAIDKTNFENDYTRNYIRNVIVPNLKEVNPNILSAMYRMSRVLQNDEIALEKITEELVKTIIISKTQNEIVLDVKKFKNVQEELKPRVVIELLTMLLGSAQGIEQVHIMDICKLLNNCITGKKYIIGSKFYVEIVKNRKAKCVKATTIVEK